MQQFPGPSQVEKHTLTKVDMARKDISVTLGKLMKQQQMQVTLLELESSRARSEEEQCRREADREDRLLDLLEGVLARHTASMPPLEMPIRPQFMPTSVAPSCAPLSSPEPYGSACILSPIHLEVVCLLLTMTGQRNEIVSYSNNPVHSL